MLSARPPQFLHTFGWHSDRNPGIRGRYRIGWQWEFSGHHFRHMDQTPRFCFSRPDQDVWERQHIQIMPNLPRSSSSKINGNDMSEPVVLFEQSHFQILTIKLQSQSRRAEPEMNFKEPISYKLRPNQNKQCYFNKAKDYEDEQQSLALKGSDSHEVRQLKAKIRTVMVKLANSKKEKQALHKDNKSLSEEILNLQNNLRQMVAGFANTSSNFPIPQELGTKIAEFYKCECNDKFFDMMGQDGLNVKGMIFYFIECYKGAQKLITAYLQPALNSVQQVGCLDTMQGPIMNVLRKAFQTTFMKILQKIVANGQLQKIAHEIHRPIEIMQTSGRISQTAAFLKSICQILLCCMISDPPFTVNIEEIGRKVLFNPLKHEPLDGFLKPKDQCWIVLPEVRKIGGSHQLVARSLVLQVDYDDLIN